MKVIETLMVRKKELLAEVEAAMKELGAIDAALNAYKDIVFKDISDEKNTAQADFFKKNNRTSHRKMTIKEMVMAILAETKSGLSATQILDEIQKRWLKDLVRTSLSPQLSRLKQEGRVVYVNRKWLSAEKDEASDAVTSEAREGSHISDASSPTTYPERGFRLQTAQSREEGES